MATATIPHISVSYHGRRPYAISITSSRMRGIGLCTSGVSPKRAVVPKNILYPHSTGSWVRENLRALIGSSIHPPVNFHTWRQWVSPRNASSLGFRPNFPRFHGIQQAYIYHSRNEDDLTSQMGTGRTSYTVSLPRITVFEDPRSISILPATIAGDPRLCSHDR